MKIFLRNIIAILLFLNFIILITNISASLLKFIFFLIVLGSWILYTKNKHLIRPTKLDITGGTFFIYLIISISLGILYKYNPQYVVINITMLLPLLSYVFTNEKLISTATIISTIKTFALIAAAFSILMYFTWDRIDFLRSLISHNSGDIKLFSRFYNTNATGDRTIRAVGFFPDAYQNGLFLLQGLVLIIEEFLLKRKKKLLFLMQFLFLSLAVYTTQTRNIYFQLVFIVLIYFYLNKNTAKYRNIFLLSVLFTYLLIIVSGIIYALKDPTIDNSVYSRYFSWVIIFKEYIFHKLFSFNGLFGYGLTQYFSEFSPPKDYWYIDNNLLSIYLGGGIVGVILFLRWLYISLSYLLRKYVAEKDLETKSITRILIIYISIFFVGGAMNVNILNIYFLFPTLILFKKIYTLNKNEI